jgi:DNA repair protein RadA/Sms
VTESVGFRCAECGHRSGKWLGRCPDCQAWNSFAEEQDRPGRPRQGGPPPEPVPFDEIDAETAPRIGTGISEFDRVLGGGVVPGSLVLIGGDPGIGKSTLLLQVASRLAGKPGRVLYVSGEESQAQVRMRGERLGVRSHGLLFLAETALERILDAVGAAKPGALVVDSIQTVTSETLPSAAGSVGQVREAAARLLFLAKATGTPTFVIGHVTKEGAIAGPRALEHIVDTVLYFEGERHHAHRILRAVKNRFGPTNEIGIFEMTGAGLAPVPDPSRIFLGDAREPAAGSVVLPTLEGSRPLLVELQALVAEPGPGPGRRVAFGIEPGRLAILVAVLERQIGTSLAGRDIYVNVAGGFQVQDPAADLAAAAALASSLRGRRVDGRTVVFGELGLTGEVRPGGRALERLQEARRLGFRRAVFPRGNAAGAPDSPTPVPVARLDEALGALLDG